MTTKFDIIRLRSLAALGNVEAMYTLGTNYLYGVGVDIDLEEAHSYLVKAADNGLMAANDQNIDDAGNGHIDVTGTVGETYTVKLKITGNDGSEVISEDIVLVFTEG